MLGALRKLAVGALATAAALSGVASGGPLAERASDRLVFCHFMVRFPLTPSASPTIFPTH